MRSIFETMDVGALELSTWYEHTGNFNRRNDEWVRLSFRILANPPGTVAVLVLRLSVSPKLLASTEIEDIDNHAADRLWAAAWSHLLAETPGALARSGNVAFGLFAQGTTDGEPSTRAALSFAEDTAILLERIVSRVLNDAALIRSDAVRAADREADRTDRQAASHGA